MNQILKQFDLSDKVAVVTGGSRGIRPALFSKSTAVPHIRRLKV